MIQHTCSGDGLSALSSSATLPENRYSHHEMLKGQNPALTCQFIKQEPRLCEWTLPYGIAAVAWFEYALSTLLEFTAVET